MLLESKFDDVTLACEDWNEVTAHIQVLKRDLKILKAMQIKMKSIHLCNYFWTVLYSSQVVLRTKPCKFEDCMKMQLFMMIIGNMMIKRIMMIMLIMIILLIIMILLFMMFRLIMTILPIMLIIFYIYIMQNY